MGDAGPQQSTAGPTIDENEWVDGLNGQPSQQREINVLVTGFGPFKSFARNPSWLIASTLPDQLILDIPEESSPSSEQSSSYTTLTINLHVFPSHVPVAYSWVSSHIPELLRASSPSADIDASLNATPPVKTIRDISYDHVLHIGMAGGRNYYSLETLAHRDGYKIKDIEGKDGFKYGESIWKDPHFTSHGPAPEVLEFAYDELDVWERWVDDTTGSKKARRHHHHQLQNGNLYANEDANGTMDEPATSPVAAAVPSSITHHQTAAPPWPLSRPTPRPEKTLHTTTTSKPFLSPLEVDLRISHDPGHFLCDFIFYTSLAERFRQRSSQSLSSPSPSNPNQNPKSDPDKAPRVIFLHVPGDTDSRAVETGRRVAEGLIRAVVGSWECGKRNKRFASVGATSSAAAASATA